MFISCNKSIHNRQRLLMKSPVLEKPLNVESNPKPVNTGGVEPDRMVYYNENKLTAKSIKTPTEVSYINNSQVLNTTNNKGHLVYKIPTEMYVRNTYQVMVRISKSTVNIYENLNGDIKVQTIPVTETMEVRLVDPSPDDNKKFNIISDNSGVQLIDNGDEVTQWTWNVTPLSSGSSQLKIIVSIVRDGNKKEVVYQDTVEIKMDLSKQISYFFGKYWKWLLSSLVLPFGIWFYNKRKKKEKPEPIVVVIKNDK